MSQELNFIDQSPFFTTEKTERFGYINKEKSINYFHSLKSDRQAIPKINDNWATMNRWHSLKQTLSQENRISIDIASSIENEECSATKTIKTDRIIESRITMVPKDSSQLLDEIQDSISKSIQMKNVDKLDYIIQQSTKLQILCSNCKNLLTTLNNTIIDQINDKINKQIKKAMSFSASLMDSIIQMLTILEDINKEPKRLRIKIDTDPLDFENQNERGLFNFETDDKIDCRRYIQRNIFYKYMTDILNKIFRKRDFTHITIQIMIQKKVIWRKFMIYLVDKKSVNKNSEIKYFTYNPKSLEKIFSKMKSGQQLKGTPKKNTIETVKSKSGFNNLFFKLNLGDNKSIKKWFQENIVCKNYSNRNENEKENKLFQQQPLNRTNQTTTSSAKEPFNQMTFNIIKQMKDLKKYMLNNLKKQNEQTNMKLLYNSKNNLLLNSHQSLNNRHKSSLRDSSQKNQFAKTFNQCNSTDTFQYQKVQNSLSFAFSFKKNDQKRERLFQK